MEKHKYLICVYPCAYGECNHYFFKNINDVNEFLNKMNSFNCIVYKLDYYVEKRERVELCEI